MKKSLLLIAASLLFSLVSCDKAVKPSTGIDDEDEGPTFESLIKIDGDFSDWNNLPKEYVTEIKSVANPKAGMDGLKSAKIYADNMYVNVLITFSDKIANGDKAEESNPVHVYFDVDNSTATGGYADEFTDAAADFVLENGIYDANGFISWDPAFFKWWGEVNGSGWLWTDPDIEAGPENLWGAIIGNGGGIAKGMGKGNQYELQIFREMMVGAEFAETFGIGIDIQEAWTSCGILPNAEVVEGSNPNGLAPMAKVKIHRTEVAE